MLRVCVRDGRSCLAACKVTLSLFVIARLNAVSCCTGRFLSLPLLRLSLLIVYDLRPERLFVRITAMMSFSVIVYQLRRP